MPVEHPRLGVVYDGEDVGPTARDRVRARRVDQRRVGVRDRENDVAERRHRLVSVVDVVGEDVAERVGGRDDVVRVQVRVAVDERGENGDGTDRIILVADLPHQIKSVRVLADRLKPVFPPVFDDRFTVLRVVHTPILEPNE